MLYAATQAINLDVGVPVLHFLGGAGKMNGTRPGEAADICRSKRLKAPRSFDVAATFPGFPPGPAAYFRRSDRQLRTPDPSASFFRIFPWLIRAPLIKRI